MLNLNIPTCTNKLGLAWWLKPIFLATWEAEIRKITVGNQPVQKVHENLSQWKKLNMVVSICHHSYSKKCVCVYVSVYVCVYW
jgi:hypothetical protein